MNKSKRVLLIINPKAGTQGSTKGLFNMINAFCKAGYDVSVRITQSAGDATETVKNQGEQFDIVVCSGGDGTLNEVIAGVVNLKKKPQLGYIPSGSTNDFASNLGLAKNNFKAGAERIVNGKPFNLDIGMIDGKTPFSYVASFGAFCSVSYSTPQSSKNILGRLAYFLEAAKDLPNIKPIYTKVTTAEGKVMSGHYLFGGVANTFRMAGVLKLDSLNVSLNDGVFECLLIKTPENPIEFNETVTALATENYDSPYLDIASSSSFTFEFDERIDWTIDGEYGPFDKTVKIEAVPGAIQIII